MRFLSRGGRSLVPSPEHHGPKSRLEPPIPPSANRPSPRASPKFIFSGEGRVPAQRQTAVAAWPRTSCAAWLEPSPVPGATSVVPSVRRVSHTLTMDVEQEARGP